MPVHPIEALIRQHLPQERGFLDGSGCDLREDFLWIDVGEAIARTAVCPEHAIGERPLALFTMEKDYPACFNGFLLFTDRRMVGRFPRLNGTFGDVHFRYGWLEGARESGGMLSKKLEVKHAGQVTELQFGLYDEKLLAFINAVAALPPDQREPALSPLSAPSETDPTGARAALAALTEPDARTAFLLQSLAHGHETGLLSAEIGADLVSRVVLAHRNDHHGRGVSDGSWMSPLGKDDLSHTLVALYQNPLRHIEEPHRSLTFDSRNKVDKVFDAIDKVDGAVDAVFDPVGALVGKAFGGGAPTTHFTVMIADTGSFSSFRLFDGNQPLSTKAPELAEDILWRLDRLEAAVVLRRCAYGWNGTATELLQVPSSDIVQRFEGLVGPFDATVLGRPRDQRSRRR